MASSCPTITAEECFSSEALLATVATPADPSSGDLFRASSAVSTQPDAERCSEQRPSNDGSSLSRSSELSKLLADLEDVPRNNRSVLHQLTPTQENALVQVRLGIASSLYTALKWKHEPTARHCLRVALGCSAWVHRLGLPPERRDEIEVAALLHDIGKIGIPEQILTKPAKLTQQEAAVIEGHWLVGLEILRSCCAAKTLQDILLYTPAWFDGSKLGFGVLGESLPLGSRIIAIMDAFDSMTTDHDWRPALTREQAFQELYRGAGRQFDPRLVKSFCELHDHDESKLLEWVPRRWLQQLDPGEVNAVWRLNDRDAPSPQLYQMPHFQERLIDELPQAVVFVDSSLRIIRWNGAAERLTGVAAASVYLRNWAPSLLRLRDERKAVIRDDQCPVAYALRTNSPWSGRLHLRGRTGHVLSVAAQALPVPGEDGLPQGMVLTLHETTEESPPLDEAADRRDVIIHDPLTQLLNRAEFDRRFDALLAAHAKNKHSCSLIIVDIDELKAVNHDYGHRAGDDVIRAVAALLPGSCRGEDIVARYDGEQFVIFCAQCDGQGAKRRAEDLRIACAHMVHDALGDRQVTASFGVTEILPGDTPDTMIRRADRALAEAKAQGRNTVVELGCGQAPRGKAIIRLRRKSAPGEPLVDQQLASHVPLDVSVEKLRGFIADHHATIVELKETRVVLAITCGPPSRPFLAAAARPTRFTMEIEFREERARQELAGGAHLDQFLRTLIQVVIRPERSKPRQQRAVEDHARQLLISLRAYLMAVDPSDVGGNLLARARHLLTPWRGK